MMEQRIVSNFESRIEKAIAETIMEMGLKRLPLLPSQRTMHLIAKSAVNVYEAESSQMARTSEPLDEVCYLSTVNVT